MKRKNVVLTTLAGIMLFSQVVSASSSWSDARTWSLTHGGGYKVITTTGEKLGANKTSNSESWQVYTVARTMNFKPKAKLVNSSGADRSDVLTTPTTGNYKTGSGNTGTIGYAEYLAVKPAMTQVGTDTIKLQMKNY